MICAALAEGQHTDPDKSVLTQASVKLDHPETYVGGSDLKEFEVFVAGILRWLKMNCLLGETSIDMQVNYLGTRLTGKAQEWFYRNVEQFDHQVHKWTLEVVVQGLQRRFLHTLTHHHASNKFDTVSQGTKTVQEVLNDLKKYAMQMIHPPDVYMFCKQLVSALHDLLCNEVLKKGYNAEFSTINQLYETARMIEEASRYNHGMRCTENMHTAVSNTKPTAYKTLLLMGQSRTVIGKENIVHRTQTTCTYNAPKPEQKTVQVKDSLTKLSYQQKPLPQLPKREGNSMNVACYKCGQAGYIRTNCPHLMKVRTAAIRADGTEDPEMDPQEEDEVLPPDKEGEGDNSEHQGEQLNIHMEPQYQWDTEEEEETDDNAVSYRTNAIRIALDTEKQAMVKIMAA